MFDWLIGPVNSQNVWEVAIKSCIYGSLIGAFAGSALSFGLFLLYEQIKRRREADAFTKRLSHAIEYTIRRLKTDQQALLAEEMMLNDATLRPSYLPLPIPSFDNKVVTILEHNLPPDLLERESFLDLLGKASVAFDQYQEHRRLRNRLTEVAHPQASRLDDYSNFCRSACQNAINSFTGLLSELRTK